MPLVAFPESPGVVGRLLAGAIGEHRGPFTTVQVCVCLGVWFPRLRRRAYGICANCLVLRCAALCCV
jgi:hypothetical protein